MISLCCCFLLLILVLLQSNPIKRGYSQIRSSAWLEHYTDNVGVSSSNLLGSTFFAAKLRLWLNRGISSAG